MSEFSPNTRPHKPLEPLSHEIVRRAEPLNYKTILGSSRVLLLAIGRIGTKSILTEHLEGQASIFKRAGITHYVTGTLSFIRDRRRIEDGMRAEDIETIYFRDNVEDVLRSNPNSRIAIVIDAYLALKKEIAAYLNGQSLGVTLPSLGYETTSILYTDFGLRVGKFGFGLLKEEFMLNVKDLREREDIPPHLTGLDYLVHLPHLNDDAK